MKKILSLFLLLFLAGCDGKWVLPEEPCKNNGGVSHLKMDMGILEVHCEDGYKIKLNRK